MALEDLVRDAQASGRLSHEGLRGKVSDLGGHPIGGVQIRAASRGAYGNAVTTTTAPDGTFVLPRPIVRGRSLGIAQLVFNIGRSVTTPRSRDFDCVELVIDRDEVPEAAPILSEFDGRRALRMEALGRHRGVAQAEALGREVECSFRTAAGEFREQWFGLSPMQRMQVRRTIRVRTSVARAP